MEINILFVRSFELITYLLFNILVLNNKLTASKKKLFFAISLYLISFALISFLSAILQSICLFLLHLIIYLFMFEQTLLQKIKTFVLGCIIVGLIDIFVHLFLSILFNIDKTYLSELFTYISINVLWAILCLVKQRKIYYKTMSKSVFFNISLTGLSSSLMLMSLIVFEGKITYIAESVIILVTLLSLFLSIYTIIKFIQSDNLKYMYQDRSLILQKNIEMQLDYYDNIFNQYKSMLSLQHDLNMHFFIIENLLHEKEYDKLNAYFYNMNIINDTNFKEFHCPDLYISSILYNLYRKMKNNDIKFKFYYYLPIGINMDIFEKCTIFYSLIANSIEICKTVTKNREIFLTVDRIDETLLISIINSISLDISEDNPYYKKSIAGDCVYQQKECNNIENIIKKYNGSMYSHIDSNKLQTDILLYNIL